MHIRFTVESESPETARTYDVSVRDTTTGDGQEAAFRALVPRRRGLTPDDVRAEMARLRGLGHTVTGDRAAKQAGLV